MNATTAAVGIGAILIWLLVSGRAERANVSSALALVAAGVVLSNGPWALIDLDLHNHQIRLLAEVALAIVLFADASTVDLKRLRADIAVPLRLLAIGLPLTILCGVGAAFDFAIGRVDQAPGWMQKAGVEWLFRLLKDPKRLFGRYLTTLPVFVVLVLSQRLRRSRAAA